MEFDNEGNIKSILEGIKKADSFYSIFKEEFYREVFKVIKEWYPDFVFDEVVENLMFLYAVAILNSTEAVIDKDRNYPDYRLEEDLEAMTKVNLKLRISSQILDLGAEVHEKTKVLMVRHFDAIFDLSSTGFRLLEQNAKLYNQEFLINLYPYLENME
ncbi:MAG TPA: hypothetical protein PLG33_09225 [Prolixibacteraceae bacterium]|nr:hypothetical protein [Prolixibacteraceae bacterium]HPR86223.1 hypothetical protein [Prolixibacteraceae bacterium]